MVSAGAADSPECAASIKDWLRAVSYNSLSQTVVTDLQAGNVIKRQSCLL